MRERELFIAALQKADSAERLAFLDAACADDDSLRRRVRQLLTEHEKQESFLLDAPPVAVNAQTLDLPTGEGTGSMIGPYKLLQRIGEGGMGVVWMAEQIEPVQRKVALKVIKPGMDSRQVIARFEAERQALAMMDHVNIARVFDGGATENGRPYFVMELVHGIPITKYCDDNHLTPRERLELFVPVCQAIQHAHQKGIIHRDIKPSNVMVTLYDGKPVPKVIDFGVAKACRPAEQKLTERTMFTQYGTMVGTLEYMSPEQAEMSALGVDTRSDIYSLGVLLYELLTGSTPLTHKRMKEAAYAEILRMIKEEEPPKPSTRLSDSGEALAWISAQRKTEPAKLTKLVRGELDWIVMKTLEKDRERRYETASSFAADVRRYLNDEPVQACPQSAWYRFRKFAGRNRTRLLTGSLLMVAVLVTLVTLAVSNLLITREKDAKVAALAEAKANLGTADQERRRAEANLQEALEAVRHFYLLVGSGRLSTIPEANEARRELLEDALKYYEAFLVQKVGDPTLRYETAIACEQVANFQEYLGRFDKAEQAYHAALRHFAELAGAHPTEAKYRVAKASLQRTLAKYCSKSGRTSEAAEFLQKARTAASELATGGVPPPHRCNVADLLHGVGYECWRAGLTVDGEEAFRQALKLNDQLRADEPGSLDLLQRRAYYLTSFGLLLRQTRRLREAEETHRAALGLLTAVSDGDPRRDLRHDLARAHGQLGAALWHLGQREEACERTRQQVTICQSFAEASPSNPTRTELALATHSLGQMLDALDRRTEAEDALRQAAKLIQKLAHDYPEDPEHPERVILTQTSLGILLAKVGKNREAEEAFQEVGEVYRRALERRPTDALANNNYAWFLVTCPGRKLWDPTRAVSLATNAAKLAPQDAASWHTLGVARYRTGDWEAATQALDKSMSLRRGGDSSVWFVLAMTCWQRGEKDQARHWFAQAVTWMKANKPEDQELKRFRQEAESLLATP